MRPLAAISLSVAHSQFFKNIFMKYQIYLPTFIVISRWGGGRINFQSLIFLHRTNVQCQLKPGQYLCFESMKIK